MADANTLISNTLVDRIADFLRKHKLQDKTIIVGFSGGYDSMCLLDVLSKLKEFEEFWEMNVIAAHFNHNWRGEESLKEQEICRLFASACGMEFYTATAKSGLKKTENEARIARYEFFEEAYDEYDADAVLTAHNKDDNAETILYRITKGTGLVGLKGILEKREIFYRPLLKTTRYEIVNYCEENNLIPNNDSSNSDTKYRRNYLRLNIIPALEKINPSVKDALNSLAEVACSENEIIDEYLESLRKDLMQEDSMLTAVYKRFSKPVKMRFIYEYIQKFGLDYDFKKIKEIYDFIEANSSRRNGNTLSLATAKWLYVDEKIIETIPRKCKNKDVDIIPEVTIDKEGVYQVGKKTLTFKRYIENDVFIFPDSSANFVYVDLSNIKLPLTIRTRRDGDIINPFGMRGSMKLKKYLNAKGVNRQKRDEILLLTNENEVLWVVGVGLSDKIGVTKVPTHVIEID